MNLAVVGLGYVGLPLALLAERRGWRVTGIDVDKRKVELINKRQLPFEDETVKEWLKTAKVSATTDFSAAGRADVVAICVPTPVDKKRRPDYGPLKDAGADIAPYLRKGQLVIVESSVNPGGCEEVLLPVLEAGSGLKGGEFYLAHCPERVNPGDREWNVGNLPRVIGGLDKPSLERAVKFYRSVISADIRPMASIAEAEAVKIVENSFRNVNIAFVNELARSFSKLGIDVVNVINGAATKPFGFMAHYPGCGVGGHCIPVDPYYLIDYARKQGGAQHPLLALALKTNEDMPKYTVGLAGEGLKKFGRSLEGAKIAVLGLAFKADIDDSRESPALEMVRELKKKGARVAAFDPHIPGLSSAKTLAAALKGADAAIVATAHKEFRRLGPGDFSRAGVKVVIDGRNCLGKAKFARSEIYYRGIGR